MATKTIVLGTPEIKHKKKNPIQLNYFLDIDKRIRATDFKPSEFNYIELVTEIYDDVYDLMFAYNDPTRRNLGVLFLGKWNDGVVE